MLTHNSSTSFSQKNNFKADLSIIKREIDLFLTREGVRSAVFFLPVALEEELNIVSDINLVVDLPSDREYLAAILVEHLEQGSVLPQFYSVNAASLAQWKKQLKPEDFCLLKQFFDAEFGCQSESAVVSCSP